MSTTKLNTIEAAVAKAQEIKEAKSLEVVTKAENTALSTQYAGNDDWSFDETSNVLVDSYVSLKASKLCINTQDTSKAVLDVNSIEGYIECTPKNLFPVLTLSYKKGANTYGYIKSYDNGVTTADGLDFEQEVAKARVIDPACQDPFISYHITMVTTEPVLARVVSKQDKLEVIEICPTGTILGYSSSRSVRRAVERLKVQIRDSGIYKKGETKFAKIRMFKEEIVTRAGQSFTSVNFELLGEYFPDAQD